LEEEKQELGLGLSFKQKKILVKAKGDFSFVGATF
jgi:hypothetical protein